MIHLVFIEGAEGKIKKSSLEALAYANAMGGTVIAIGLGTLNKSELETLGKYGATKVLHASDARLDHPVLQVFTSVLVQAMQQENADHLILANSALATPSTWNYLPRKSARVRYNGIKTAWQFRAQQAFYTRLRLSALTPLS